MTGLPDVYSFFELLELLKEVVMISFSPLSLNCSSFQLQKGNKERLFLTSLCPSFAVSGAKRGKVFRRGRKG
jgi:hypothetical protein